MINKPPVKRAFQVRPANGSFLDRNLSEPVTKIERDFERIVFLLGKKTQQGRDRPR